MASYDYGKPEIIAWIKEHFEQGATCLDVGACDGKWADLLGGYMTIDAVEVFAPNITANNLQSKYRAVFNSNIIDIKYDHYDLVLFGDVIEHMTVEDAQTVLEYARGHSTDLIVGVPFLYVQGELYGNPWERHIQDDLTPQLVAERYPSLELILSPAHDYAYYHERLG